MSTIVIVCTALVAGIAAFRLTGWMRDVARVESGWLTRYVHVVLAVGAGAGAAVLADNWAELVGYALLGVGCALLVCVDVAAMRLPNVMVGPLYLGLLVALSASAIVERDGTRLLIAVGCSVGMCGLYLLLAVIRRGQLGMGDVKFGAVIGLFLGWLGWGELLLGMLAAFALSGAIGLVMMWYWKLTPKNMYPFGPYMVAGAVVGAVMGADFLVIA